MFCSEPGWKQNIYWSSNVDVGSKARLALLFTSDCLNQDDGALYGISNFSCVILPSQVLQTLDSISAVLFEATELPVKIQATQ